MRTFREPKDAMVPRSIYCEYTYGRYRDDGVRSLEKNLPFLNPSTGLHNRMIIRDPITGLGELPAEWDPFREGHIDRKTQPKRDPIRMEGDLGGEYNCLYTTKELKCKPREDRDPIRLKGDLGKELDPFNPDGSASFRRRSERTPRRDPILGTGDFSSEPDPFPHLNSRGRFYRQSKERTDPITHSFPERGARNRHSMRQYNERWIMRDPILHRYGDENGQPVQRLNEMRHFAQQRAGNSWLSSSAKNLSSNDGSTRRPYVQRNPITGEGMRPEDYNDLQRVPSEYHFRQNPTVAHHVPSPRPMMSKSISATMAQPSRPTRSAVSPPRSFMRTTKSPMKSMDSTTIKEAPVVKKVVRPKRSSTVERARLTEDVASKDRVEPNLMERTNGRKLSSPRVSVRESSARASESKVMSFFEEAQMANEKTWNETKETSEHTGTISEPRESVDYAESAQSLENEVTEENLYEHSPSEELDQENQCTETQSQRPIEPTEPSESHTPNLDLAASGNLFEELQVHDEQHSVEDDVLEAKHNGNLLGTTAPLFVSTGEEEGDEPHVYAYPADNEETDHVRDVQQHSGRQTEASVASDKEDDYIGAFLKTQTKISLPLDNTHETALSNYAVHTETSVNLEKPDDVQSPLNPEDLGSPHDSSIVY